MEEKKIKDSADSNRSIERAADILKLFKNRKNGMTFTEIWQGAGLSKATAHRIVNTLLQQGFLSYDEVKRRYDLGSEILQLGMAAMKVNDIVSVSHDIMERLQIYTRQSVVLYVRRKLYKVCVAKIEKEDGISYAPDVGCPLPIWRGSSGMIMLSEFASDDLPLVLQQAREDVDSQDEIEIESIKATVEKIKKDGYMFSDMDYGYGAVNLAVPVRSYGGRIIGSLNLAGAEKKFSPENRALWISELKTAAKQISTRLGYFE